MCALCLMPIDITKGHRQNIACGLNRSFFNQFAKWVQKPKAAHFCLDIPVLQIDFPKRLRTMFRGINLCGAKNNATLSDRHRAHLFVLVQRGIISVLRPLVKPQISRKRNKILPYIKCCYSHLLLPEM